jgi:hypothetical protein
MAFQVDHYKHDSSWYNQQHLYIVSFLADQGENGQYMEAVTAG